MKKILIFLFGKRKRKVADEPFMIKAWGDLNSPKFYIERCRDV